MPESAASGRLSKDVRPLIYRIDLTVLPKEKRFFGSVSIDICLNVPTRILNLHVLDLKIKSAQLISCQSERLEPELVNADVTIDPASETLQLLFSQEIPKGTATISIVFSGNLNHQMRGLYEANANGEVYAFTQFEATDARRMFPCFDEPGMKAQFQLSVSAPAELTILSNMPAIRETIKQLKRVDFEPSPPMSSYLLALAVARLEKREIDVDGMRVAVWTLPGQLKLGGFALKVAASVLPLLDHYFDLRCPTKKLDLVSVPDFAMGAMENWGLIFFRDIWLLLDEEAASAEMQRGVASVITHEIVHQWFGNLVTMDWWDDLWLNESFATWLACKIIDQWRPEWLSWLAFQEDKAIPLALDALENTRPIRANVTSPAEIEEMFDVLTYEKGGACLRMIEQFLGEETFRLGIRRYIMKYRYKNATAENLWSELSAVSNQPISQIARDWFTRPGFPIIKINSEGSDFSRLNITQHRFSAFGNKGIPDESDAPWSVPFSICYGDDEGRHTKHTLLTERETALMLPVKGRAHWVYGNAGEAGFYRSEYDTSLKHALETHIEDGLDVSERVGLLGDLWALCQSGDLPITSFLETLCRLKGDENRGVVVAICNYIEILSNQIVLHRDRTRFAAFIEDCLYTMWEKVSWDAAPDDDDERRLLRPALLWMLGAVAQNEEILSELPRRQRLYLARPNRLDPTLATAFVRLCVRSDGGTRFEHYIDRFRKAKTPEERDRYLTALSDFGKPAFARKVLDFSLTDDVRSQDVWKPVRSLLSKPTVQAETWIYLKTHWQVFREKGGSIGAQRMIQATRHLWRSEWYNEVGQFFKKSENRVPSAERSLAQTLEFIQLGLQFKNTQSDLLSSWLTENY